ncbi:Hypothetical protein D9617_4g001500 [Elsinoe fawcettii]|nr:Hypothetical protein D9617_4g001500 [Elsinoe fawcettii]
MPKSVKLRKHNGLARFTPYNRSFKCAHSAAEARVAPEVDFKEVREATAEALLVELEEKIGKGAIAAATKQTGGVQIVWDKKMLTTAGYAITRPITTTDGIVDKDTEAHGATFKKWSRVCEEVLAHHHVKVTTRHSYEVKYKYVGICIGRQVQDDDGKWSWRGGCCKVRALTRGKINARNRLCKKCGSETTEVERYTDANGARQWRVKEHLDEPLDD